MRNLVIALGFLLTPVCSHAQLFMLSDNYINNPLLINPAFSGSQEALSISLLYRNNWTGFEGSPKTISLSIHTPIHNEKIGLGLLILNDKIGVNKETNFIGNYAYRLNLGEGKIALGLGVSLTFQETEWNKLNPQDPDDDLLSETPSKGVMADFSTGMYYSNKKFFISLSIPLFLSHEYDNSKNKYTVRNEIKEYNYFANAGYCFDLEKKIKVGPSFLVKYYNGNTQIDLGSNVIFSNRFSLGATYRSKNILMSMLQIQVNNQLKVGYFYDFNVGQRSHYKYNSNEIMISYIFKYFVNVQVPRDF